MSEKFATRVTGGPNRRPQIVLFVEEGSGDWHARQLKTAMETMGAGVVITTLKACAFDTRMACGIDIPGFEGTLPDGAFVRSVSTGSLEQITLRLGVLHALRESGVRVWNDARTIERCVDKSTATFLFQQAGLPVPPTRVGEGLPNAQRFMEEQRYDIVVKPLFGSQGNGVTRVSQAADLPAPETVGNVYYAQRYLRRVDETEFVDWRILVSGGRILAAMSRAGATWVTNIHQGATAAAFDYDEQMGSLALRACAAIGADYAGVDIIRDEAGNLMVLEINSNPAWKGLQSVTDVNIAWTLAEDFLQAVAVAASARNATA
ncbi:MAG: RimK family alpha-L-glutamate ligase [Hyphomicrobiaceae bacterium]|nr:RimK family alpha-L-glutamate ligase [Hyphomicrobiaceae bacterium]